MNTKLFVASLPFGTTEEDLINYFNQAGTVLSAKIIFDRNTGKSRGFGFVVMSSPSEAEQAIKNFNGSKIGHRNIVVSSARSNSPDLQSDYMSNGQRT